VIAQEVSAPSLEELETELLLEGIYQYFGDDFRGFARIPLRRKLTQFMRARELPTISAVQALVMHDSVACAALCRLLARREAALFEAPAQLLALRELLRPWLRSCAAPKIWLAEATSAEEVFTLVILLAEEGFYERSQVFATGPDESLLTDAQQTGFAAQFLPAYADNYRRSGGAGELTDYLVERDGRFLLAPRLHDNITWGQSNLASDSSFNEFQLIFCRKALADFGPPLRRRSLKTFSDSLSAFGILCLDVHDHVDSAAFELNYRVQSQEYGLYRRTG
jgi:chemotaxis protein methyltransferase CheR